MPGQPSGIPTNTLPVEIKIAADLGQLSLLRALAETVALLADLTLDDVADLRLAIDEVATILILAAVPESTLRCEFAAANTGLLLRVSATSARPELPDKQSFGWHVLTTLTDRIDAVQQSFDASTSGYPTTIELGWLPGDASAG